MKFFVKVKPKSRENRARRMKDGSIEVWVKDSPEGGKANERLIEVLAKHFGVVREKVYIKSGWSSRRKMVEVELENEAHAK